MSHTVRIALACLALSTLAPRGARAESTAELVEAVIKTLERTAADVEANKPDCEKIGTALAVHIDDDAAVMAKIKAADAKKTAKEKSDERKAMEAKYGERMNAVKAKLAPLKACKSNAKVADYAKRVMGK